MIKKVKERTDKKKKLERKCNEKGVIQKRGEKRQRKGMIKTTKKVLMCSEKQWRKEEIKEKNIKEESNNKRVIRKKVGESRKKGK